MATPPSLPLLRWILFFTVSVAQSSVMAFRVTEGSTVILSCHYSVKQHGLSHVCWGRDCGTFWCNDIIVQTDENGIISKVSDRYRLIGDILSGQMDLGIQHIRRTDSGSYCCRIDIDGLFNDKKLKQHWLPQLLHFLLLCYCKLKLSDEAVSSITLQINIPVLSVSLSLLLLLLGALILLAFKRAFHIKVLDTGCLNTITPTNPAIHLKHYLDSYLDPVHAPP
ncbi:hypothetical protein P4O66_002887 [Electrophorus voltai]|uniref:Ig-like domain-containing protein n=1 Tax=Electrophorus voltai TaxID=2609070 RepID=A0AAD8YU25_9TELE|nr:hypothetical protein P4O66_002887 [Electrophorus voltai]